MATPKRVGIYTRSAYADPPLNSDESLPRQLHACRDHVRSMAHLGWRLAPLDIYEDMAISGATLKRPALQRLLTALDQHAYEVVVVHRLDRVGLKIADVEAVVARIHRAGATLLALGVGDSVSPKVKSALSRLRRTL